RATSASMDIEPPKFISVNSDKTTYKPGEQILLTVISEDETNVDYVYASFTNNTEIGPYSLSGSAYQPTKISGNRYEYIVEIDIPERTPSTTYRLAGLYIDDGQYTTELSDWYGEELLDLEISITGKNNVDINPPKFISVDSDKKTYKPGEQILLTVISEDETNVDYVYASFTNNTEIGPYSLSGSAYQPNKISGNRYEYIVEIDIPERTPSTTYRLAGLYIDDGQYTTELSDWYGEELLDLEISITGKNNVDINPPKFISVDSDKKTYKPGEQILLTVISEDETNVDYVYASFTNNTEIGPYSLSGSAYQPNKISGNRYEYIVEIDIPERTPSTTYRLAGLYIDDGQYTTELSDWYGEELLDLEISITGKNNVDINPPKFISVDSDKKTYKPGEQILLTVISEDETNVDYVYASFTNNTEIGPYSLSGSAYQPNKISGNRYEYIVEIDIPERTPSTTYRLAGLYIDDGQYTTELSDWYGEELLDLEISITGKNNVDINPPKFISVDSDKKTYKPGEQILLTVISEDETNVDYVYASFTNNTEIGPYSLSGSAYQPTKISGNRYEYIVEIDIPERTPSTTYRLAGLYIDDGQYTTELSDWYGEELLDLEISITGKNNVDINPPKFISVDSDKKTYKPGEQILLTVISEDETNVD